MPVAKVLKGAVPVKVWTDDVDSNSMEQLKNIASLPFIHKWVAAMPDVHCGMGATVGSVIPTKGAIIPAAVGVDIGCGMEAVRLSLTAEALPDTLAPVRSAIEARVPVGFAQHEEKDAHTAAFEESLAHTFDSILAKHPSVAPKTVGKVVQQLGTLGGGNHFIELCLDEQGDVWVMLHSGSRGIGNLIGQYFISRAREEMEARDIKLADRNLAYLVEGEGFFADYIEALSWAQRYAHVNRVCILLRVLEALSQTLPPFRTQGAVISCHHNYTQIECHYGENVYVTRKGAIRARSGDLGIIPGSMGTRSYIVRGKGNDEAFHSCAHGAGRRMSRSAAKAAFTQADLTVQTHGVECRKDAGVVDEIPAAYKDIDEVMRNQSDLVEIVHVLKQVLCVKG